jgi:1-deoxy-D-xylulose-5-phosphate synthase
MQRAYDQIIHDVALQKLHVVLCIDRGGLVGEDGPTHHGAYDIAYLRCIPNMIVAAPMNEEELRNMMFTAQLRNNGPFSIRYPKGKGVMPDWETPFTELEIGKGRKIKDGNDAAIITIGHVGNFALEAISKLEKEGYKLALYDMRFVKPLDNALLHEVFGKFDKVITIEDGTIIGGLGSAVLEFASDYNYKAKVVRLGIPDNFIEQGTLQELYNECGYHVNGIIKAVKELGIK